MPFAADQQGQSGAPPGTQNRSTQSQRPIQQPPPQQSAGSSFQNPQQRKNRRVKKLAVISVLIIIVGVVAYYALGVPPSMVSRLPQTMASLTLTYKGDVTGSLLASEEAGIAGLSGSFSAMYTNSTNTMDIIGDRFKNASDAESAYYYASNASSVVNYSTTKFTGLPVNTSGHSFVYENYTVYDFTVLNGTSLCELTLGEANTKPISEAYALRVLEEAASACYHASS